MDAYANIDMYSIYTPVCIKALGTRRTYPKLPVAPRLLSQHVIPQINPICMYVCMYVYALVC